MKKKEKTKLGVCRVCGKPIANGTIICNECEEKQKNRIQKIKRVVFGILGVSSAVILLILFSENDGKYYFSQYWMRHASDEDLEEARERVRLAYCNSGDNDRQAYRLQSKLWSFDDEMSRRAWGNQEPYAPSIHREHGWYLPNDD